jgi:outer membrane protein assembly factor BamB
MRVPRELSVFLLIGGCLACTGIVSAQQTEASAAGSVTYQINPAHTGAIQLSGFKPPLAVQWSVNLGAPVSYPLVADGMVFVLTGPNNASQVNLYALNATTGATVWGPVEIPEGAYWWAAAAYANGTVFVVPDESNPFGEGAMLAFDATTGSQLWSVTLEGQYLFNSAPVAVGDLVYTGGAGSGGTVYAVAQSTGKTVWTAGVENGNASSPAVSSSGVYVSYVCPQAYDFNPKTGKQIWHYSGPCEGGGGDTPVLYVGSLYVRDSMITGADGAILNATSGAVTGSFNSNFAPAFLGTTAFYTESGTLTAVDISTGATIWTASPTVGDSYASPPIVVNRGVYIGTAEGYLEGYDTANGKQVASINLGAAVSAYETDNYSNPLSGLGAGNGLIIVPATNLVVAVGPK